MENKKSTCKRIIKRGENYGKVCGNNCVGDYCTLHKEKTTIKKRIKNKEQNDEKKRGRILEACEIIEANPDDTIRETLTKLRSKCREYHGYA